jgi:transketolase
LIAFTDHNKAQIDGSTDEIVSLGNLSEKWKAFGWNSVELDGHDVAALDAAITKAKTSTDKPTMIVMHTVKGKGTTSAKAR